MTSALISVNKRSPEFQQFQGVFSVNPGHNCSDQEFSSVTIIIGLLKSKDE